MLLLATEGGDWGDDDGAVIMKENPDDWSVCEVVDGSDTLDNWVELWDEDNKLWNMDVDVEVEVLRDDDPFEHLEPKCHYT